MAIVIKVGREELKDAMLNVIDFIESDDCQRAEKVALLVATKDSVYIRKEIFCKGQETAVSRIDLDSATVVNLENNYITVISLITKEKAKEILAFLSDSSNNTIDIVLAGESSSFCLLDTDRELKLCRFC